MDNIKEWSENIKNSLTIEQIKELLYALGGDPILKGDIIIARTICHGGQSHKLYYYDNTKLFRCYTECSDIFDIYDFIIKNKKLEGIDFTLFQAIQFVITFFNLAISNENFVYSNEEVGDWQILNKYEQNSSQEKQEKIIEFKFYDDKIIEIIKKLDPPTLSIKGIGFISCAGIISEFGDVSRFKSPDAMVAFAGIEPSISESGIESHTGKMVKHGSGHLRYHLLNAAEMIFVHEPIFTEFYYKKRNEGKTHRVALSHVAKKLVKIIYKLETENIKFNRNI